MRDTITVQLEKISKIRHEAPAELMVEAIKIGVSTLYRDSILSQYLKKRISRAKAVRWVGIEAVNLAESQDQAVREDIHWGLGG